MFFRSALFCFIAILFVLAPARADDGSRVILVLDASGSMRGKIEGKSKMDIAKQVVGKIIKTWKPEDELGLVAYGHREKGSCEDIQTLIEPGQLDAGAYGKTVNALNPKGKTPMTAAVKQAAEALQYTEKKATVILVSDGIETCNLDPCSIAEELEKTGVELTVHTVGFGLDDKGAVAQLQCLAEKTGGTYNTANNANELQKALTKTVAAKPTEPAKPAFNFVGHVMMAEGVELPDKYGQPGWFFSMVDTNTEVEGTRTEYGRDVKINIMPTGNMAVKVYTDNAEVTVPFAQVAGGNTKLDVNMNAGIVHFIGMQDEVTPVTNDGAAWTITWPGGKGDRTIYGTDPFTLLNSGDYELNLRDGTAETQAKFKVIAGKTHDVKVAMGAGSVRVNATFSPGGEGVPDGAAIEFAKPAGISGEDKSITTEYGNNRVFKALTGDYVVHVRVDLATAKAPVQIEPGKEAKLDINLNAGYIHSKVESADKFEIAEGKKSLTGENKYLATTYGADFNMAANVGSYLLKAFKGQELVGEKLFDVKAGERIEVSIP